MKSRPDAPCANTLQALARADAETKRIYSALGALMNQAKALAKDAAAIRAAEAGRIQEAEQSLLDGCARIAAVVIEPFEDA